MGIRRTFSLFSVIILAVSCMIIIRPTCAQVGVTNPSIPAFSVTLQTYPQYVSPTYGVDPSTGKAVIIQEGYTEVEKWVRVEIGGQPFLRYNNSDGQLKSLFYNVRWKGNHDTSWQSLPQEFRYEDAGTFVDSHSIGRLVSIGFKGIKGAAEGYMQLLDPNATQIDFQVEALIGYYAADNVFIGQTSGWSDTQTLMMPNDGSTSVPSTTPSSAPTSTATPQQSSTQSGVLFGLDWEQTAIVALSITVVVLAFAIVFSHRKNIRRAQLPRYASYVVKHIDSAITKPDINTGST